MLTLREAQSSGRAGYVAPEVIKRGSHTPALDMYALGIVLFLAITGHRPMTAKEANMLKYADLEAHEYPNMKVRLALFFTQLSRSHERPTRRA